MNKYLVLIATIIISISSWSFRPTYSGNLSIKVENIEVGKGTIWVGIYKSKNDFLIKEKAIIEGVKVNKNGYCYIKIPKLEYGDYAVALFQDINENGELDLNLFGVPSEPFAFSQKPKSKWRLPKFDEVKFKFYKRNQTLVTKLKKWWD